MIDVNRDWIKKVFDDLPNMRVELVENANSMGPNYLKTQLILCRKYLNEVNQHLQTLKHYMWAVQRDLDATKAMYTTQLDNLIATDDRVRRGTSYKDRVAIANQVLADLVKEIHTLEEQGRELSIVEEVIKVKMKELREVGSDIRTARSLIVDELNLGGQYGSEDRPGKKVNNDPGILLEGVPPKEQSLLDEKVEITPADSIPDKLEDSGGSDLSDLLRDL